MVVTSCLFLGLTCCCSPIVLAAWLDKSSSVNQVCRLFLFPVVAAVTTLLTLILWRTGVVGNNVALSMAIIFPSLAFLWVLLNWLFGGFDVSCIDNGFEGDA